jgi:hypothetical protein
MWVEEDFQSEVKIYIPISYHIGDRKCIRKAMVRELKSTKELHDNSIYHLDDAVVSVLWKSLK